MKFFDLILFKINTLFSMRLSKNRLENQSQMIIGNNNNQTFIQNHQNSEPHILKNTDISPLIENGLLDKSEKDSVHWDCSTINRVITKDGKFVALTKNHQQWLVYNKQKI